MRRAILSLPGRKVIRHWFTEMLIGRWRPSAFNESAFVISRDFDLETIEIMLFLAFASNFYPNFALRKNPTKYSSDFNGKRGGASRMYQREQQIDLNEGDVNFIMYAVVERRRNAVCNIDNETCTWTGKRKVVKHVHWFIIYASLRFNWFNWFVQCRNTMVLYLMERGRLTLSFSELFNSHCYYSVCEIFIAHRHTLNKRRRVNIL